MRPSTGLLAFFVGCTILVGSLIPELQAKRRRQEQKIKQLQEVVHGLGLSDLALSTEARYTRHPAISDRVVVLMDHPGAIDHFPSTLFWAPLR